VFVWNGVMAWVNTERLWEAASELALALIS